MASSPCLHGLPLSLKLSIILVASGFNPTFATNIKENDFVGILGKNPPLFANVKPVRNGTSLCEAARAHAAALRPRMLGIFDDLLEREFLLPDDPDDGE